MSTPEIAPRPGPLVTDVSEALAEIDKGQQLAGHVPDAEALDRARRVLSGETTHDAALGELTAEYSNG